MQVQLAEFEALRESVRKQLGQVHEAREVALPKCRQAIRSCGLAIRAIHRDRTDERYKYTNEAREALEVAQIALRPFPQIAAAGFLHDAEKEYAEARLTAALVGGTSLPSHVEIGVQLAAWLNGLAEAASELRRNLLDRLREGQTQSAEILFETMEGAYDLLVTVDYPDAITGGLRRTTDALRAVVERSRSDLTTTLIQERLQRALSDKSP